MKLPITGGCICGAVRYESSSEPLIMFNCHCRDCQRATGGPYAAAVLFPAKALKIVQGTPKYSDTPSDLGGVHTRGFCGECGAPVIGLINPATPFAGVVASSLDDPTLFQPRFDMFTCDAQPWTYMNPELPKYEHYAPFKELLSKK